MTRSLFRLSLWSLNVALKITANLLNGNQFVDSLVLRNTYNSEDKQIIIRLEKS